MKSTFHKTAAIVLSLILIISLLGACGNDAAPVQVEPAAAKNTTVASTIVTIEADGREITIEDTAGKSIQELLDMADVTLGSKDILSLSSEQVMAGNLTIRVLRSYTVTITVPTEDPAITESFNIILVGSTVADALAAAGIELAENQITNFDLHAPLTEGMEITISIQEEEEEETVPEETQDNSSNSNNNSGYTPDNDSTPAPTTPAPTEPTPTTPAPTEPAPTEPAPTEPAPTEPSRTVVSVEIYEDCDGSGHGVKVITYSDGTQEEVYF